MKIARFLILIPTLIGLASVYQLNADCASLDKAVYRFKYTRNKGGWNQTVAIKLPNSVPCSNDKYWIACTPIEGRAEKNEAIQWAKDEIQRILAIVNDPTRWEELKTEEEKQIKELVNNGWQYEDWDLESGYGGGWCYFSK